MAFTEQQKSKLLIVGFLAAVMLVIVLYFHFIIGRGQIKDYRRRSARVEQEIIEAKQDLTDIRAIMSEEGLMEEQREMISKLVKRLPSSPDAPGFLMAMVNILRTTGIIQEMVKPERPKDRSQYTEIPYSIKAHGRYHELGQFLTLLEQNPQRFMRVKSFVVENNMDRPSVHPIEMEIATFTFNN